MVFGKNIKTSPPKKNFWRPTSSLYYAPRNKFHKNWRLIDHAENCVTSKKIPESDFCEYFHWKRWLHPHILSAYTFPWLK